MPRCDASRHDLFIEVPPKFKGVVDMKDHFGDDAENLLDFLISEGCPASVRSSSRARNGRHAICEGGGFSFRNFLVNTAEVADGLGVPIPEIVKCIRAGFVHGYLTPNGHFWLAVKDQKLKGLTKTRALAAKPPMERSMKGKGLAKVVMSFVGVPSFPVSDFGIADLKSALESEAGWKVGRDYAEVSFGYLMTKLEAEKRVVRILDADGVSSRRWSFVSAGSVVSAPVVSASVASEPVMPSHRTVGGHFDQMVEELADAIASKAKQRAMEKLGL